MKPAARRGTLDNQQKGVRGAAQPEDGINRERVADAHATSTPQGHTSEAEAGTQDRSHRMAFAMVFPVTPNSTAIE